MGFVTGSCLIFKADCYSAFQGREQASDTVMTEKNGRRYLLCCFFGKKTAVFSL
jgi:hypothetical protein